MKYSNLLIILVLVASIFGASASWACEKYYAHSNEELKELRDALNNSSTDAFDRLFAFQKLSCSDQPIMRTYAVNSIVGKIDDPLVRQQIAFDILFAKRRIDVEILSDPKGDIKRKHNGRIELDVLYRDKVSGCLSFSYKNQCQYKRAYLNGPTLELRDIPGTDAIGILGLTVAGDAFVGTIEIKRKDRSIDVRVPVK